MKAPYLQIGTRWSPSRFWLVMAAGVGVFGFNFGSRLLRTNDDTRLLQDLALPFNLDRRVVRAKPRRTFEYQVRGGERGYLVISDRAVSQQDAGNCLRPVARGRVTRQQFLVLEPVGCDKAGPSAGMPQAG